MLMDWQFPSGAIRAEVEVERNIDGFLMPDSQRCRFCGALLPENVKRFCGRACRDGMSEWISTARQGLTPTTPFARVEDERL